MAIVDFSVQIKEKKTGHPPDAQFMKSGLPLKILGIRKKIVISHDLSSYWW